MLTYRKCNCDASCKLAQKQVQCISSRQSKSNEALKKRVRQTTSDCNETSNPPQAIVIIHANSKMQSHWTPQNCREQLQRGSPVANATTTRHWHPLLQMQKCRCNRPCKLHEQLWWLWSAAMKATSQKKVKLWINLNNQPFVGSVARCKTKILSVITWVSKNSV